MEYYLYRVQPDGDNEIYGTFNTLQQATLSAKLLLIEDSCFILSGNFERMYFHSSRGWDYDVLSPHGKSLMKESLSSMML